MTLNTSINLNGEDTPVIVIFSAIEEWEGFADGSGGFNTVIEIEKVNDANGNETDITGEQYDAITEQCLQQVIDEEEKAL